MVRRCICQGLVGSVRGWKNRRLNNSTITSMHGLTNALSHPCTITKPQFDFAAAAYPAKKKMKLANRTATGSEESVIDNTNFS
jgi:hypothetical protein